MPNQTHRLDRLQETLGLHIEASLRLDRLPAAYGVLISCFGCGVHGWGTDASVQDSSVCAILKPG
jgi:hypothetical protein